MKHIQPILAGLAGVALLCATTPAVFAQSMNGTYTGEVTASSAQCFAMRTDMTVTIQGTAVSGNWKVPTGVAPFAGTLNGNSFSTQVTRPSLQIVTIQGTITGNAMAATFSGGTSCRFTGTLSKR